MRKSVKGAVVATAVAGLFLASACAKRTTTLGGSNATGNTTATGAAEKVECWGVNQCKGKGECGSEKTGTSCAGTNACKGKGWIQVTKDECLAKGGTLSEG